MPNIYLNRDTFTVQMISHDCYKQVHQSIDWDSLTETVGLFECIMSRCTERVNPRMYQILISKYGEAEIKTFNLQYYKH